MEAELFNLGATEMPATTVGEMVLDRLKEVDQVAYIRFASVYLNFADLSEMGRPSKPCCSAAHPATASPVDVTPGYHAHPRPEGVHTQVKTTSRPRRSVRRTTQIPACRWRRTPSPCWSAAT